MRTALAGPRSSRQCWACSSWRRYGGLLRWIGCADRRETEPADPARFRTQVVLAGDSSGYDCRNSDQNNDKAEAEADNESTPPQDHKNNRKIPVYVSSFGSLIRSNPNFEHPIKNI